MRRGLLALFLLLPLTATANQPITGLVLARAGDDLVMTWDQPALPVTGFRVYRANDRTCATFTQVYDGTLPQYTAAAALGDGTWSIYRIVSYLGTVEGPPSPPLYEYVVDLPHSPTASNLSCVSLPFVNSYVDSHGLCLELNSGQPATDVVQVRRYTSFSTFDTQNCAIPNTIFQLSPGESYFMMPIVGGTNSVIWGRADALWPIDLQQVAIPASLLYLYGVSLPFDHDYPDVAAIAVDIPSAVFVKVVDPAGAFVGLERSDSTQPWQGTNPTLSDRLGLGLMIGVDVPTTWYPRQHCNDNEPILVGPACALLYAVRDGADVDLSWSQTPGSGYDVYRVTDKQRLANLAAEPVYLPIANAAPTFPVADIGAVTQTSSLYYQVAPR